MNIYNEILNKGVEFFTRVMIIAYVVPGLPPQILDNFINGVVVALFSFMWVLKSIIPLNFISTEPDVKIGAKTNE